MNRLIDLRQEPTADAVRPSLDEDSLVMALEGAYAARLQAVLRGSPMELSAARQACEDLEGAWVERRRFRTAAATIPARDSSYYLG